MAASALPGALAQTPPAGSNPAGADSEFHLFAASVRNLLPRLISNLSTASVGCFFLGPVWSGLWFVSVWAIIFTGIGLMKQIQVQPLTRRAAVLSHCLTLNNIVSSVISAALPAALWSTGNTLAQCFSLIALFIAAAYVLLQYYANPRTFLILLSPFALVLVYIGFEFAQSRGLQPVVTVTLTAAAVSLVNFFQISRTMLAGSRSALRRARARARDGEERFRILADSSLVGIYILQDSNYAYVNPAMASIFGYSVTEMTGMSLLESVQPSDRDIVGENIRRRITGEVQTAHYELRGRYKDGSTIDVEVYGSRIDINGKPSVVGTLIDITERKRAEETVALSEARYRVLADHVTDLIIRYDRNSVIEYASPSIRQLGYAPEDVVGRNMSEFGHPAEAAETLDRRKRELRGDSEPAGRLYQLRARRSDGEWVWMECNPSPIRDGAGEIVGAMTVYRDITERRVMEDELRAKRAEAEAAAIAKTEFLANMSHEIRTPLTAVLGFTGLLSEIAGLPERASIYLKRISDNGQSLLSVVNDILDFSRLEGGQLELDPHPFDPEAFIHETADLVRVQARNKGLELTVKQDSDLPAAVLADSGRARQVLLNFLSNAIKFTAEGTVVVGVSFSDTEGGLLRFTVEDTGVGIPAEKAERLFKRFSQIDSSITRQYGGSGLGLAISKSLVEMMGGEIGVESIAGRGSLFWFTLAAPVAELQAATPEAVNIEPIGSLRMLLVDDVEANRELVSAMLSPFDIEITQAGNGAEAVTAALRTTFDVILMDLQMPGMDGLAATRAIRANSRWNRSTPILALSANVLPMHLAACHEAGLNDHIAKPIKLQDLLEKVMRWTEPEAGRDGQASPTDQTASA
jgi:PAS domain S-box-containing protein